MKKRIIRFFAATILGFAACSSPENEYYITGQVADPTAEGKTVYLFTGLNPNRIDSTLVKGGRFEFVSPIFFNDYGFIQLDNNHYAEFLLERDTIVVDLLDHSVEGGALNELFAKLKKEERRIATEYEVQAANFIQHNANNYKDDIALEAALDSLENANYVPKYKALNLEYFEGNENNMIGVEVLYNLARILPINEIEVYLRQIGTDIEGHSIVQGLLTELINYGPTGEGKMFQDFMVKQTDGRELRLSDYVGKGKYVMVEFWASWCTPCIEELPYLKGIYEKYKDRNFEILGVSIWDNAQNSLKAIEKYKIPWPQILNAQEIPAVLYDFKSVPYIILFAPDGTILKRGIFKEEVLSVLTEHIN